jgi:hypothetical protein
VLVTEPAAAVQPARAASPLPAGAGGSSFVTLVSVRTPRRCAHAARALPTLSLSFSF